MKERDDERLNYFDKLIEACKDLLESERNKENITFYDSFDNEYLEEINQILKTLKEKRIR